MHLSSVFLARFVSSKSFVGGLLLASAFGVSSCSEESLERGVTGDGRGDAVRFVVGHAQDAALAKSKAGVSVRGALVADVSAEDLASRPLAVTGADGLCLIESTVEGVNPVEGDVAVRGRVVTAIESNFSSSGYRATTPGLVAGVPWFHGRTTSKSGNLASEPVVYWDLNVPHARFFGVYPEVGGTSGVTLSPASHTGVPYLDFAVASDVASQKDLLTATSDEVHYQTAGIAPEVFLNFRHALTAVKFAVGQNLSLGKVIRSVELRNAVTQGRYVLADNSVGAGRWTLTSTRGNFVLNNLNVSTDETPGSVVVGKDGDNFTFFMLPQELSGVTLHVGFTDGTSISSALSGTWKAGTTKTYHLSEANSNWDYTFSVTPPVAVGPDATATGTYQVTSYRNVAGGEQRPVKWQVVGYDANGDGDFSLGEKPSWLTLSRVDGDGGAVAQTGVANLSAAEVVDLVAERTATLKNAAPKGSAGNYYNLANQTDGGSTIKSTANCYVISAPGFYRIPLVYGNAIKEGAENTDAFAPGLTGANVLARFKGHDGSDITSPYINVQHSANRATQAAVVWADAPGLVSGLGVQGSGQNTFLQFEVKRETLVNGNAVVAVKNAAGQVMWSWHLWFAPANVLDTIRVRNHTGVPYDFASEPLGWKLTGGSRTEAYDFRSVRVRLKQFGSSNLAVFEIAQHGAVKEGRSTYYQFGRKDAFPGVDAVSEGSFTQNGGNAMSFANGIQNPGVFYTWGTSWANGYHYYNLWSAKNSVVGFNDNPVIKTIYDPSPVGFKLPASNAFSGFTTTGISSANPADWNVKGSFLRGWHFYTDNNKTKTIFFLASGGRSHSDGVLNYVDDYGNAWSALSGGVLYGNGLNFSALGVNMFPSRRSHGFPVYPVLE